MWGGSRFYADPPPAMAHTPFNLNATNKLDIDREARFVNSSWEEELGHIPNVGPVTQGRLKAVGITTSYQLVGQFLMFREIGDTTQERCTRMCSFLVDQGVAPGLTHAITLALAKKINMAFVGFFVDAVRCGRARGAGVREGPLCADGPASPSVPFTPPPTHTPTHAARAGVRGCRPLREASAHPPLQAPTPTPVTF